MEVRSTLDTTTRLYGATPEFTPAQLALKIRKGKLRIDRGNPDEIGSTCIGFLRDSRGTNQTFSCKVVAAVQDKSNRILIR